MKKSLKKIIAGVGAATMLATTMPIANAFAAETAVSPFGVRTVTDGVVITSYSDKTAEKITIPATIDGKAVVGVDNFAFGLVSQEVTIVVPASLKAENIDDEAFVTSAMINTEIIAASGKDTINGVIKYWIGQADPELKVTDEQINDAVARAIGNIGSLTVTGLSLDELAIKVVKEIQAGNCGFSANNLERLDLALSLLPYNLVTLTGPDATGAQTFAKGKINLKYVVASTYIKGDVNRSGKLDLQDVIAIAKHMLAKEKTTLDAEQIELADYNGNGKVDLQDAIGVAKAMLKK